MKLYKLEVWRDVEYSVTYRQLMEVNPNSGAFIRLVKSMVTQDKTRIRKAKVLTLKFPIKKVA